MNGREFKEGENGWLSQSHLGSDSSARLVLMHGFFYNKCMLRVHNRTC